MDLVLSHRTMARYQSNSAPHRTAKDIFQNCIQQEATL